MNLYLDGCCMVACQLRREFFYLTAALKEASNVSGTVQRITRALVPR
jgi:hypothetical protein